MKTDQFYSCRTTPHRNGMIERNPMETDQSKLEERVKSLREDLQSVKEMIRELDDLEKEFIGRYRKEVALKKSNFDEDMRSIGNSRLEAISKKEKIEFYLIEAEQSIQKLKPGSLGAAGSRNSFLPVSKGGLGVPVRRIYEESRKKLESQGESMSSVEEEDNSSQSRSKVFEISQESYVKYNNAAFQKQNKKNPPSQFQIMFSPSYAKQTEVKVRMEPENSKQEGGLCLKTELKSGRPSFFSSDFETDLEKKLVKMKLPERQSGSLFGRERRRLKISKKVSPGRRESVEDPGLTGVLTNDSREGFILHFGKKQAGSFSEDWSADMNSLMAKPNRRDLVSDQSTKKFLRFKSSRLELTFREFNEEQLPPIPPACKHQLIKVESNRDNDCDSTDSVVRHGVKMARENLQRGLNDLKKASRQKPATMRPSARYAS